MSETTIAPEQTGFELDRFMWSGPDRLEVEGRWFGVRGRRFVRPSLTVQVGGRRRRLLALLEHKPWPASEGEAWIAAFPWSGDQNGVGEAELEVGALTVDLPAPGGSPRARKRKPPAKPVAPGTTPAVATPPEPREAEPIVRPAGETRHQLERDLAAARAELGRARRRHEDELRELRSSARQASERLEALETAAADASTRAERYEDEARRLREELEIARHGSGAELDRLREAESAARAEAESHREAAQDASNAFEEQREFAVGSAAEIEALRTEARRAVAEAEQLREARLEALAENQRLREAARRSAAEAERLRAASRRPGASLRRVDVVPPKPDVKIEDPSVRGAPEPDAEPGPAPDPDATVESPAARPEPDPQATVPFKVLGADDDAPRSGPPPTVRRIPRPKPGTPAGEEASRREEPAPAPAPAPSVRPAPGAGASRLLGEQPQRPNPMEVWGPRLVAVVLVVLLLVALALIVRGVL
jgi:hypothetical protein